MSGDVGLDGFPGTGNLLGARVAADHGPEQLGQLGIVLARAGVGHATRGLAGRGELIDGRDLAPDELDDLGQHPGHVRLEAGLDQREVGRHAAVLADQDRQRDVPVQPVGSGAFLAVDRDPDRDLLGECPRARFRN